MSWFKKLTGFLETRFFTPFGVSGFSTAKRVVKQPQKELTRATGEAIAGLTIAEPLLVAKGLGKIMPKTPKGIIGTAVGAPIAYGVLSSSKTARKAVKHVLNPVKNIKRGQNVGKVIEETTGGAPLTSKGLWTILKGGAIAGTIAGVALAPKVITKARKYLKKRKKEKGKKEKVLEKTPTIIKEKPLPTDGAVPITPPTKTISTTPRKRYKRRYKKKTPSVRQSVRVIVNNVSKSSGISLRRTEKYLNGGYVS